jgi:hypothetical protein
MSRLKGRQGADRLLNHAIAEEPIKTGLLHDLLMRYLPLLVVKIFNEFYQNTGIVANKSG